MSHPMVLRPRRSASRANSTSTSLSHNAPIYDRQYIEDFEFAEETSVDPFVSTLDLGNKNVYGWKYLHMVLADTIRELDPYEAAHMIFLNEAVTLLGWNLTLAKNYAEVFGKDLVLPDSVTVKKLGILSRSLTNFLKYQSFRCYVSLLKKLKTINAVALLYNPLISLLDLSPKLSHELVDVICTRLYSNFNISSSSIGNSDSSSSSDADDDDDDDDDGADMRLGDSDGGGASENGHEEDMNGNHQADLLPLSPPRRRRQRSDSSDWYNDTPPKRTRVVARPEREVEDDEDEYVGEYDHAEDLQHQSFDRQSEEGDADSGRGIEEFDFDGGDFDFDSEVPDITGTGDLVVKGKCDIDMSRESIEEDEREAPPSSSSQASEGEPAVVNTEQCVEERAQVIAALSTDSLTGVVDDREQHAHGREVKIQEDNDRCLIEIDQDEDAVGGEAELVESCEESDAGIRLRDDNVQEQPRVEVESRSAALPPTLPPPEIASELVRRLMHLISSQNLPSTIVREDVVNVNQRYETDEQQGCVTMGRVQATSAIRMSEVSTEELDIYGESNETEEIRVHENPADTEVEETTIVGEPAEFAPENLREAEETQSGEPAGCALVEDEAAHLQQGAVFYDGNKVTDDSVPTDVSVPVIHVNPADTEAEEITIVDEPAEFVPENHHREAEEIHSGGPAVCACALVEDEAAHLQQIERQRERRVEKTANAAAEGVSEEGALGQRLVSGQQTPPLESYESYVERLSRESLDQGLQSEATESGAQSEEQSHAESSSSSIALEKKKESGRKRRSSHAYSRVSKRRRMDSVPRHPGDQNLDYLEEDEDWDMVTEPFRSPVSTVSASSTVRSGLRRLSLVARLEKEGGSESSQNTNMRTASHSPRTVELLSSQSSIGTVSMPSLPSSQESEETEEKLRMEISFEDDDRMEE